jgi:N-acyl-D-amino-acid deacylase
LPEEFDLLIKNATVVDGSGKPAYKASIGVKGDRVSSVGDVKGDAKKTIEAKGLTAVPGFIDSHSHGDMGILFFPKCESYVLQGVTTFVGGQCGASAAPIGEMITLPGIAQDYIQELEPHKYYPKKTLHPRERVNEIMEEKFGWTVDWYTMADWFKVVEDKGISMNMAPLVGHNTVRATVMGDDYKRHTTEEEMEEMTKLIRQSMEDGCFGMSIGLDYDPSVFASRDEVVEHVKILNEYGGVFCPHSRRTGRRRDIAAGHRQHDKIDGILEVLDICRATGVRMNIAHLFTGWYVRPDGYPHILEEANRRATLNVIDDALKEGLDISFDVIPTALPTRFGGWNYLCALFIPWLRERGTRESFAEWLKVEDYREEIKDAIRRGKWFIRVAYNPNINPRWAENITVLKHKSPDVEDKNIAQIAEERGADPFDIWFDLIAEDPDAKGAIASVYPSGTVDPDAPYHVIFYQHPKSAVGVDTGVNDYKWVSKSPPWMVPGINTFSAFVGFFEKFVNQQKSLTLEQAVHKTSTQAAVSHSIKGRGVIKKGSFADIVLMDLANMKVTATPLEPRKQPRGIEYVIVNGVPVVEKAQHTGATPGRVLKRE